MFCAHCHELHTLQDRQGLAATTQAMDLMWSLQLGITTIRMAPRTSKASATMLDPLQRHSRKDVSWSIPYWHTPSSREHQAYPGALTRHQLCPREAWARSTPHPLRLPSESCLTGEKGGKEPGQEAGGQICYPIALKRCLAIQIGPIQKAWRWLLNPLSNPL